MNVLAPRRLGLFLLLAPAVLWLALLILLPHVEVGLLSFRERVGPGEFAPSLKQYLTFFDEPLYWHTFVRTALMSVIVTVLALLLAFPVAWSIAKVARGRVRALLMAGILLPFWASELVRMLGWLILLRGSGVIPQLLFQLGLTAEPVELLYHDATILVGLVYSSLLFMLVPLEAGKYKVSALARKEEACGPLYIRARVDDMMGQTIYEKTGSTSDPTTRFEEKLVLQDKKTGFLSLDLWRAQEGPCMIQLDELKVEREP